MYRDAKTGQFISISKARDLGKVIYKIGADYKRVSRNFRPPPLLNGLIIRDAKTGKILNIDKAAGKWVKLEKWENGKRLEVATKNRYGFKELKKIKDRLKSDLAETSLLKSYKQMRKAWHNWGSESEKMKAISISTKVIIRNFRNTLNKSERKKWDKNIDKINRYIFNNFDVTSKEADEISFDEFEGRLTDLLNNVKDNLNDVDMLEIPF